MHESLTTPSDTELWNLVLAGRPAAFEEVVSRYKNLLCSVAYSRCGDFALSEDLAQDAFWAAWESRESLREPDRLRSWLCGILRNLAASHQRRSRPAVCEFAADGSDEMASSIADPAVMAISQEEESLVWQSLEEIPETYREPLVLFYREEQSVAEVAEALDLSEDAVKQRLSRGRAMLRDRMADAVEGALRRTRPTAAFTVAVMAGITASAGGKAAFASGGGLAAASTLLATTSKISMTGALGGLAGGVLGLLGGYLGVAVPAYFAPTARERDYLLRCAKRTTLVTLVMLLVFLIPMFLLRPMSSSLILGLVIGLNCLISIYITIEVGVITSEVRRIRSETPPESDLNQNAVKAWFVKQIAAWEPRNYHYRSAAELWGIPLVSFNGKSSDSGAYPAARWTTGWIACGARAQGLIALGGIARGGIAIGGLSFGVVSFGGLSFGLLACGGAVIAGWALGGLALGWQSLGGLALGWDLAVGGAAVARRAAFGGAAWARDYAVGGSVSANHANDELAREVLNAEPFVQLSQWQQQHPTQYTISIFLFVVLFQAVLLLASYRRKSTSVRENE